MFDMNLVLSILRQIDEALEKSKTVQNKFIAQTISLVHRLAWKNRVVYVCYLFPLVKP